MEEHNNAAAKDALEVYKKFVGFVEFGPNHYLEEIELIKKHEEFSTEIWKKFDEKKLGGQDLTKLIEEQLKKVSTFFLFIFYIFKNVHIPIFSTL